MKSKGLIIMNVYMPEQYSKKAFGNYRFAEIREACENGTILEAPAMKCDKDLNLEVDLGPNAIGKMPFSEFEYSISGKPTKAVAVLSKVGKAIQFKVIKTEKVNGTLVCQLSRKAAQKECYDEFISKLQVGQVISARATYVESYGIFCDIGCGIPALIPIENFCTTRINEPKKYLSDLSNLKVVVKSTADNKITLSHKELLGTWEHEAAKFNVGDTVTGTVRIIESYGVFVQLTPNLVGLADVYPDLQIGDDVTVYIKSIYPNKMKVKLLILSKNEKIASKTHFDYQIPESGYVNRWVYSPESCEKKIETNFCD